MSDEPVPDDPLAGSLVVELAPEITSAQTETPMTQLGPPSIEQVASQAKAEAKEAPKVPDAPPVAPSPAEPEPDLAFQQKEPEKKPEPEVVEKPAATQSNDGATAQAASVAMSPPKADAPKAAVAAAPMIGISPLASRAKVTWNKTIAAHLERFKRYPQAARAEAAAGSTLVEFTMDRAGAVIAAKVIQSSGSALFDAAALDMIARASPLPPAPKDVAGASFTLTVPVVFRAS